MDIGAIVAKFGSTGNGDRYKNNLSWMMSGVIDAPSERQTSRLCRNFALFGAEPSDAAQPLITAA
jgi:hypothetical protein